MSGIDLDFGILTNDTAIRNRAVEICKEFEYSYEVWEDLELLIASGKQPKFVLAYITSEDGPMEVAEVAQIIRHALRDPFLICISLQALTKDAAIHAKKSGSDLVLINDEVLESGKLEFVSSLIIRSRHIPIKPSDLNPYKPLSFDLYHLLPQRMKFLKMAFAGDLLNGRKMKKVNEVGEVYIDRDSASKFNEYISDEKDQSKEGIEKRCRGQFLALSSEFSKLAIQLTSRSEHATIGEGQEFFSRCSVLCTDLLKTLAAGGEAWKIVNNSGVGGFGALERAPAISAYVGLFSKLLGLNGVPEIMLSALLSDLGVLFLKPRIIKSIRDGKTSELSAEDRIEYENYPQVSLSVALDRKLSIPEKMRNWIISTQERADGTGFPKQLPEKRIAYEAKMISFCREFDQRTLVLLGKERVDSFETLKTMSSDESTLLKHYGSEFMSDIKRLVKLIEEKQQVKVA